MEFPRIAGYRKKQYKEEVMEKKRRRYPETFKKESVEYLINSGKAIVHVARESGTEGDATLLGASRYARSGGQKSQEAMADAGACHLEELPSGSSKSSAQSN